MKTTNYYNAFIEVAEDCPTKIAQVPMPKADMQTAATLQFDLIFRNPYKYSSDDVLFMVYAQKNRIDGKDQVSEREKFFSKGQPCFRASPLTKRYGWGVHSNADGKIAIYAMESDEYSRLAGQKELQHVKAMRSRRL